MFEKCVEMCAGADVKEEPAIGSLMKRQVRPERGVLSSESQLFAVTVKGIYVGKEED